MAEALRAAGVPEAKIVYPRLVKQSGTWNRLVVKYFGDRAPDILKAAR